MTMNVNYSLIIIALAACRLEQRVADAPDAAPPVPVDAAPDSTPDSTPVPDGPAPFLHVLPAGTVVPSVSTNAELMSQIKINDGLSDVALMTSGGVVTRGTGKAGGAIVRFWNFGPAPVESGIAVAAPLYIFGTVDAGVFTALPDHPPMIDTVPGDIRYSPIRRVVNVPVTSLYAGELITSLPALTEAVERGLVDDPVPDGTWVNLPVVLPGITLEIGGGMLPLAAEQVFGRGYRVDVFKLGTSLGRQPLRNGFIPIGHVSGLQTGVPTATTPPTLPTAVDPQPVFQYSIPTVPPAPLMPNYSPLATDVTVRLANGVAPSAITSDFDLFRRTATGAITAFVSSNVDNFTIQTTTNNLQLQFTDGAP